MTINPWCRQRSITLEVTTLSVSLHHFHSQHMSSPSRALAEAAAAEAAENAVTPAVQRQVFLRL